MLYQVTFLKLLSTSAAQRLTEAYEVDNRREAYENLVHRHGTHNILEFEIIELGDSARASIEQAERLEDTNALANS